MVKGYKKRAQVLNNVKINRLKNVAIFLEIL